MFNHICNAQCEAGVESPSGMDAHRKQKNNKNKRHLLFWWAEKLSRQHTTKFNPGRTGAHTTWASINAAGSKARMSQSCVDLRISPRAAATLSPTVSYSHTTTFPHLYLLGVTQGKPITTRPVKYFILSKPLCFWSYCCSLKLND